MGLPMFSSLCDLGGLGSWRNKPKRGNPPILEDTFSGMRWRVKDFLENTDKTSPSPHAIIALVAHVPANHATQSLTLHEIRAIVNILLIRISHRPFSKLTIHPLLVLFYAGEKHGRILQAIFDGEDLVIQYSQLWSFANDTAPVELFVRYGVSQLVDAERIFSRGDIPLEFNDFDEFDLEAKHRKPISLGFETK
ncbi:uncharacterized protein N7459_004004 [Penicillium hispanicum]|uniref:uncharacterized protein n=1 Tax=Penicillium hispanicum TaxID=1080232 RepID=UPI00253FE405|nr:uncharacterized protein N7459_004004 [Penicillium hispanicum]KAJ5584204.1 hypothetical protein N7459_004004 [Penicillium hispanicum]